MRIVMISEAPPGGIADYTSQLITALKKQKVIVEDIRIKDRGRKELLEVAKKCQNCDVVHIQYEYNIFGKGSINFPFFINKLRKNFSGKLIFTMHSVRPLNEDLGVLSGIKKIVFRIMNGLIKKNVDCIIVHTESAKNILIRDYGFTDKKIKVVPMWCPKTKKLNHSSKKRELKILGQNLILCWGFLQPHKNYEEAIKAMRTIEQKAKLVVLGGLHPNSIKRDSRYLSHLKKLTRDLKLDKRVTFLNDYVSEPELEDYIYSADIVVLPYKTITSSAVFYKTISLKKPIIASEISFFKEMNLKFGIPAIYRPGKLGATISRFLKNKSELKRIRVSASYCLKNSNIDKITPLYKKVYYS